MRVTISINCDMRCIENGAHGIIPEVATVLRNLAKVWDTQAWQDMEQASPVDVRHPDTGDRVGIACFTDGPPYYASCAQAERETGRTLTWAEGPTVHRGFDPETAWLMAIVRKEVIV